MEFPELGTHCAVKSCSRLDFLPFECDACQKIFCKDHKTYEQHDCQEGHTKDMKVPVCPLCSQPVPVNRGEDPNIKVNDHIQRDCQSDKAKKLYTNRCSHPGCKKKELVPVQCNSCLKNFCLKHRFGTDHNCQGHPNKLGGARRNLPSTSRGAQSTSPRQPQANRKPQSTTLTQIGADLNRERQQRQQQRQLQQYHQQPLNPTGITHASMSEDEALARAIAASMSESAPSSTSRHPPPPPSQPQAAATSYEEDEALARAIAASLNEEQSRPKQRRTNTHSNQQRQSGNTDSGCNIS